MKVLFVCTGNAHRSPLAEALLKKLRPDLKIDSAGIHTSIPISEQARRYLTRENAEQYLKGIPENLESKQLDDYDLIIAMEQRHKDAVISKCPNCSDKTVVWNIEDPYFLPEEYGEKIFKHIRQKVKELADSL